MKLLTIYTLITALSFSNFALSQESAFDSTQDITVEEEALSKTYLHQGKATRTYNENCANADGVVKDVCINTTDGSGSSLEKMLPFVTKAYALVVGIGGAGGDLTKRAAKSGAESTGKAADGAANSKDTMKDYCKYIPVAGEAYATATTQLNANKAQENYESATPQSKQAASLYSVATIQKDLSKTSKTQAGIWAAGGACYGVMMAMGASMSDWKIWAKMGGSLLIASFYKKKADAHKDRAEAVEKIADTLPNSGECNPFTNTTCFCNEETSFSTDPINFQKFCVPKPLVSRNKYNTASVCIDQNGSPDVACGCAKTDKCIDKNLKIAALKFGLNPTVMKDPLNGLESISNGFSSGSLDTAANNNFARLQKALKSYNPTELPTLTKDQKNLAKKYNELGIPKKAAIVMASRSKGNSSGKLPASFTAGISGNIEGLESGDKAADKRPEKLNIRFNQGGKVSSKKKSKPTSPFAKFKKKRSNNSSGNVQIEDFAEKARREAEIIPDKQKIIFDIISYRYKVRAWREFETTFTKSESKERN